VTDPDLGSRPKKSAPQLTGTRLADLDRREHGVSLADQRSGGRVLTHHDPVGIKELRTALARGILGAGEEDPAAWMASWATWRFMHITSGMNTGAAAVVGAAVVGAAVVVIAGAVVAVVGSTVVAGASTVGASVVASLVDVDCDACVVDPACSPSSSGDPAIAPMMPARRNSARHAPTGIRM
jgi:hypothetical protein